jgi:Family of unknown function (DUF6328)
LNDPRAGHTDAMPIATTPEPERLPVPFQQRFTQVTNLQQAVYSATLVCGAVAAAVLIAPWFGFGLVRRVRT